MEIHIYGLYIQERADPNPNITYAISFMGVAHETQRGFQFLRSNRTSFSAEFENLKL